MDNLITLPQDLLVLTETKNKDSSISSPTTLSINYKKKKKILKEYTHKKKIKKKSSFRLRNVTKVCTCVHLEHKQKETVLKTD